ncbi:MFS transporter [Enterobacter hormaechei]
MSRVSQARSLGKYFLLVDNMLVVLGFFVVFPLISIRFVDQMGWAALMVGFALGLRQFVQQGLGVFDGAIADRFGAKPMIVTGMLLRAAGFATMAIAHDPWLLWFSCFLSGIGGTLFDPPRTALVVKLIRPQHRGRFFSILMMQDSAGAVVGACWEAGCCNTISAWSAPPARCCLFSARCLTVCFCLHGSCRR